MIGLVDCNNFYASCERSFNPALDGKPVIVLSNNDGNVVARSAEAKAIGIKMAQPVFQIRELIEAHDVRVFSSNYTLYGDMSARVMATLGRFVEDVEVYSIDEAFLDFSCYERQIGREEPADLVTLARQIRATVAQWTRIPVSIGIAPTKTLAKVANWLAKRDPACGGVRMLATEEQIHQALAGFDIAELWGIGHRYTARLRREGVRTALQYSRIPDDWLRDNLTVNGLRLAYELRGTPCRLLELESPAKKAICAAPSFSRPVGDLATMSQALATHLARASEKLRKQGSAASCVTVFLNTNRFRKSPNGELAKQYSNSQSVLLPHPSASSLELNHYAQAALKAIFRFGYFYQKVGVLLSGLVPTDHRQPGLFTDLPDERLAKLSAAVDRVNQRHGRDRVRLAAQGYDRTWAMRQEWLSRRYTTRWGEILFAK